MASASHRVFAITELTEKIFWHLGQTGPRLTENPNFIRSPTPLFKLLRVCRQWNKVIEGSQKLRRLMFIDPQDPCSVEQSQECAPVVWLLREMGVFIKHVTTVKVDGNRATVIRLAPAVYYWGDCDAWPHYDFSRICASPKSSWRVFKASSAAAPGIIIVSFKFRLASIYWSAGEEREVSWRISCEAGSKSLGFFYEKYCALWEALDAHVEARRELEEKWELEEQKLNEDHRRLVEDL